MHKQPLLCYSQSKNIHFGESCVGTVQENAEKANLKPELLIAELLKNLRFGALEIVVHDGRIVHIERREKLCFDDSA